MPKPGKASARSLDMLTVADVAGELSLSEKTIRRWIKNECLHIHRLGRVIRIAREDLTAFIGRHRQ